MTREEKPEIRLMKPTMEWAQYMPYEDSIQNQIYETLTGSLNPVYHVPWAENIFVPGHPCFETYSRMLDAYARLLVRLNEKDEDEDVEVIVDSLLQHGRIIALEMFCYGRKFERMQK